MSDKQGLLNQTAVMFNCGVSLYTYKHLLNIYTSDKIVEKAANMIMMIQLICGEAL